MYLRETFAKYPKILELKHHIYDKAGLAVCKPPMLYGHGGITPSSLEAY